MPCTSRTVAERMTSARKVFYANILNKRFVFYANAWNGNGHYTPRYLDTLRP